VHPDDAPIPLDLYALGRGAAYAAALLLIGTVTYAALLSRPRGPRQPEALAERSLGRAARMSLLAATILLLAHGLRLYGQLRSFLDPGEPVSAEFLHVTIAETAWGKGWTAQVIAGALAYALAGLAAMRPERLARFLPPGVAAVSLTLPLTGHAVEHPWGPVAGVALHAIHLLGGGAWLGTLACLALAGLGAAREGDAPEVARLVRTFSPIALAGAATAVLAGGLLALGYLGSLPALATTTYGRALSLKVMLLAATALVGRYNWKVVTPALGVPEGTRRLGRTATLELALGLFLVATTAVLVALPAPAL
jgi:putative copper export protein